MCGVCLICWNRLWMNLNVKKLKVFIYIVNGGERRDCVVEGNV